jgi:hypothetical protein
LRAIGAYLVKPFDYFDEAQYKFAQGKLFFAQDKLLPGQSGFCVKPLRTGIIPLQENKKNLTRK